MTGVEELLYWTHATILFSLSRGYFILQVELRCLSEAEG